MPARPTVFGRRAFTLIEVMIVIVIIAILMALIFPAIRGAMTTARDGQVRNEISQLETAIAAFKTTYGVEPPSHIELYEAATGWTATDAHTVHSKAFIRRIWPQFDFTMARDINGDGDSTDSFEYNCGECLVFFLGGILNGDPAAGSGGNAQKPPAASCTGFAKNPANPFARGGSREGPFYEFAVNRLVDTDSPPNGLYEFLDSFPDQQNPILYFSSYEGKGYRTAASHPVCEIPKDSSGNLKGIAGTFIDVYRTAADTAGTPVVKGAPHKPNSFQIISPGADGQYGIGGHYNAETAGTLLGTGATPDRRAEQDNMTNFSNVRLMR